MSRDTEMSDLAERNLVPTTTKTSGVSMVEDTRAATHTSINEELRLWTAIKRFPKLVSYCLGLSVAVVALGYDSIVLGNISGVESFRKDYGQMYNGKLIIPAMWLSLWIGLDRAGNAMGSVIGGWSQDFMGRKKTFMMGSLVLLVAVTISFLSFLPPDVEARRGVFLSGRILQGIATGVMKITVMTYISENAPLSLRGPGMALFPTFNLTGQLLGSLVVFRIESVPGKAGYLGAFGSQIPLALVPVVVSFIVPDSPGYLLRNGREEQALRSATRMYEPRFSATHIIDGIRVNMAAEDAAEKSSASYLDIARPKHLRRTAIVLIANLFPTAFGLDFLGNISYFLQLLGMPSSPSLIFMIAGVICGIASNGFGMWILTRVGRRPAILVSFLAAGLLWGAMGISGFWKGVAIAYFSGVSMIFVVSVSGMGSWPAAYAIIGETSALYVRAKTQAVGGVVQQGSSTAMGMILPYIYNPDAGNSGGKLGFLFFGLCMVAAFLSWLLVPEMKGRSTVEIDRMFELELPARKFKAWQSDVE